MGRTSDSDRVAALRQKLERTRVELADELNRQHTEELSELQAERDAALAVIQQVQAVVDEWHDGRFSKRHYEAHVAVERIRTDILAASPADALAAHDREVKATALNGLSDALLDERDRLALRDDRRAIAYERAATMARQRAFGAQS